MFNKALSYLAFLMVRVLASTYRYEFINPDVKRQLEISSHNYIFAVWHNNIIATILAHIGECHIAIVSASKDGEIIAKILTLLGNRAARGSSSRGGVKALVEMIKIMKNENLPGAISVDGPRGPIYKAKKGIVEVARETGAYILPLSCYPSSFWSFQKSWDQFRLPKPFSKIFFQYGEPIFVEKELDSEKIPEVTEIIEKTLCGGEKKIKESINANTR